MRKFLTGRQRVVFDFVRQRIFNDYPPTFREVAAHLGISQKAAYDHLWAIRKKGYIDWQDDSARTFALLPPYNDDTRHSLVADADIPQLNIRKGDYLHVDTGKPVADGDVILSAQGEIKRFSVGDIAFGKVVGVSRPID